METLSWTRLEEHLGALRPVLLPMGGGRNVCIGVDGNGARIFVRLGLAESETVPVSPFVDLIVEKKRVDGVDVLEVSTATIHLHREFHRLAGLLTEEYERAGQTAIGALTSVLKRWGELVTERRLLSAEEQLGLFGELAVLLGLLKAHGPNAVSSWTGRAKDLPQRHDFRVGFSDIEVKATRLQQRVHYIHGLRQLEPIEGHELFLVSLQFEMAGFGSGTTLCDRILDVRSAVSADEMRKKEFEEKLLAAGYFDGDAIYYQDRFVLSGEPAIIPVDQAFPKITYPMIRGTFGADAASRIDPEVTYRVNVEGLGVPLSQVDKSSEIKYLRIT